MTACMEMRLRPKSLERTARLGARIALDEHGSHLPVGSAVADPGLGVRAHDADHEVVASPRAASAVPPDSSVPASARFIR